MTNPAARDLASYRDRFAIFEHLTYINSCSQGALSTEVAEAYADYLGGLRRHGSPWEEWVGVQEDVRALLASILGAQVHEVAVTSSASAAVNAIASSFDFVGGPSTIVTTDMEFPTIGQIWHAQERRGARVVHVPAGDSGVVSPESIAAVIDADTALVSITHACYRNGAMNDVAAIVETAHAHGVPVLVDAYQTVGAIPINFAELGADFLVGGALKYMLSSAGVGFALVNSETTARFVPTATGWFAAQDIFAMEIGRYEPATDARRFESGTPVVPSLFAAKAGLGLLAEIGVDRAWAQSSRLHDAIRAGVEEMGGTVVTPREAHGAMLAVATTDEHALVAAMENDGVIVSSRDGNVRISPHLYNNDSDVSAVLASLSKHRHLLI